MRRILILLILAAPVILGQTVERQPQNTPRQVASDYLRSSSAIADDALSSVYLAKEYTTAHNGVTHLVYRQRFRGFDVHNAAWAVNVGPDGSVLSAAGALYPEPDAIDFAAQLTASVAVKRAVAEVNPELGKTYKAAETAARSARPAASDDFYTVRFEAGDLGADVDGRLVWFAHRGKLLLAWLFNVVDEDQVHSYDVAVEAATGAIIDKRATTFFQAAPRGFVFDQGSPQPNPRPGERVTSPPPVVERTLASLSGDPVASPLGWIIHNETAGYNAVVGQNVLGQQFITTAFRTQAVAGNFNFPVALGPGAPNPLAFVDAANVNLFYWVNRAHDLFYTYGFDEAAGNFQANNYGRGGAAGDALLAYTHFGAAGLAGPALNNAFFNARSLADGSSSMIAMYTTITGPAGFFADGAYAADVIIHEYTHGVSLRLLPDGYGSFQTAAMGEGWSDFFGLEFTIPDGSPVDGAYATGEYWNQSWGTGIRSRPYSTSITINPLTYADLGRVIFAGPQVHADGEIWVQALWEARANLIRQFGDQEGRRRIRRLVIDGLMLSPPSPTMVDARDAILLADRVNYEGASQQQLWAAFAKRGLGALAFSDGGDTAHVLSSFEAPSSTGKLKFHESTFVAGEPVRVILSDANKTEPTAIVQISTSSGDIEDVILTRSGSIYAGASLSSNAIATRQNGFVNMLPGDVVTASYSDANPGAGAGSLLVQTTVATQQPYSLAIQQTPGVPAFPNETRVTNVRTLIPVDLTFEFPFFSKKYRSMMVDYNGIIWFEPSVFTSRLSAGCHDVDELRRIPAIAPLFTNLNFGSAQPNEGIYISAPDENTIHIRWAAETFPAFPLLPPAVPEPVNFAVTLTSDGVVTFYYGAGNENLHSAAQTLSTCGPQPAVGLSNGHDVYARNIALRTYTNAQPLVFIPPFNATTTPQVILERPAAGETVRGVMRVTGIAYESAAAAQTLSFVSRRDILIDGVSRAVAAQVSRPDYCAANAVPGCPFVGFQSELNLAALNLAPGPHTISVRVTNTRGGSTETPPVSFNVDAGAARLPKGAIELPAAGAELSGIAQFRGYAYADDLRVARVDLLIDGVTYPGIGYGVSRPDVCATLSPAPPNCPNIGWTLTANTRTGAPPLPDGPHSMQLRVLDETGRFTLVPDFPVPFTVKNGPQALPVGAVTSIRPNEVLSGVVSISGYAYSPVGRIISIILMVDGSAVSLVQYGLPRPQECATLLIAACPNIGFNVNFDTRTIPNGNHVIGVRITNDSGLGITVPDQVRNGMNVVVHNP
jgi:hypothetical protein